MSRAESQRRRAKLDDSDLGLRHSLGLWVFGYFVIFQTPQDSKTPRPQDPKTPRPQDPKTPRLQDFHTSNLRRHADRTALDELRLGEALPPVLLAAGHVRRPAHHRASSRSNTTGKSPRLCPLGDRPSENHGQIALRGQWHLVKRFSADILT
jgi:hypothetical protein